LDEDVTVRILADTTPFEDALRQLGGLSENFGSQLTGALKAAVISGKALDDILRQVALNLAGMALNQGLAPLQALAGSFMSSISGAIAGALPFAKGGVPGPGGSICFMVGSWLQPTYFRSGSMLGSDGGSGRGGDHAAATDGGRQAGRCGEWRPGRGNGGV
jgi:phage-related minor tail protein